MTQVAIIGAGPYGLSIAAHLRSLHVPCRIFGTPIDTWRRHMPAGMSLKSDGFASNLSAPDGQGTIAEYCAAHGIAYHRSEIPVELATFTEYAQDFQRRFVPDVEDRQVVSLDRDGDGFVLELDDGETVNAALVVCAVGITHFAQVPEELAGLPAELVSHSSAVNDVTRFAGREVIVIGGGSSAVDTATLIAEAGAITSLVARGPELRFNSAPTPGPRGLWTRLRNPSTGIGPGWKSWLCQNVPHLFRYLPGDRRLRVIKTHLGPKSAWPMKARFDAAVSVTVSHTIEKATEDGGRVQLVLTSADGERREVGADHVIAATGYRADLSRLRFISDELRAAVRTHAGMPVLSGKFESSVPRLYFVGPPAVNSFGPLMRFMVGAEYAAPRVSRRLARSAQRSEPARAAATA